MEEQFSTDNHAGMVVDDADGKDPPALAVFNEVWKVTGISLIPMSE